MFDIYNISVVVRVYGRPLPSQCCASITSISKTCLDRPKQKLSTCSAVGPASPPPHRSSPSSPSRLAPYVSFGVWYMTLPVHFRVDPRPRGCQTHNVPLQGSTTTCVPVCSVRHGHLNHLHALGVCECCCCEHRHASSGLCPHFQSFGCSPRRR